MSLLSQGRRPILNPLPLLVLTLLPVCGAEPVRESSTTGQVLLRLITLDPGHFHAALFHKEMLPGVSEQVHVYAPLGPDLLAHLNRMAQFNNRRENPTHWKLEVHTGPDFLERMLAERRGNVVVLSGNNRGKIDRIAAAVRAGLHVLADKPWIIEPDDLPKLQAALETAEQNGVVVYDAMTQRFEISCILPRELVSDPDIFGVAHVGSPEEPAVYMESVHYLVKEVAGAPLQRPPWFFDLRQQGECLADAGPHLADLVLWTLFPNQTLDYRTDLKLLAGTRRPLLLSRAQFQRVTGQSEFPDFLTTALREGRLEYFADNRVVYQLRGSHVMLDARWEFEAAPGGKDTELAIFRGTRSRIEVRQGKSEGFIPEVYVVPTRPELKASVQAALARKVESLQRDYPGLTMEAQVGQFHVAIPDRYRIGHEAHFALLSRQFLNYVRHPQTVPAWEKPNMLAKYFVTTKGVERARAAAQTPSSPRTR